MPSDEIIKNHLYWMIENQAQGEVNMRQGDIHTHEGVPGQVESDIGVLRGNFTKSSRLLGEKLNDLDDRTERSIEEAYTRIAALEAESEDRALALESVPISEYRPMRIRANMAFTSKGIPTPEVTVDGQDSGKTWPELRAEMKQAVADLKADYPAPEQA